jgi:hypothetical protein
MVFAERTSSRMLTRIERDEMAMIRVPSIAQEEKNHDRSEDRGIRARGSTP